MIKQFNYTVRHAKSRDIGKISSFINEITNDTTAIIQEVDYFIIIEDENEALQGMLGIEALDYSGILRSFIISPTINSDHLLKLFSQSFQLANEKGLKELYVVLKNSQHRTIFSTFGFEEVNEDDLSEQLLKSKYFVNKTRQLSENILKLSNFCG